MDDREIIARVLAGERESFHVLVQRHAGPLLATLRAQLGNREDAREVFQETWLRAFQRLETLREVERVRSWLLAIAFNLVQGRRRRALARSGLSPDELAADPGDEPPALEQRERLELLRRGIEALPARQREVVDLRVNHELAHAEIARLLSISEEASRASYYQALKRLRAALGGGGGDG